MYSSENDRESEACSQFLGNYPVFWHLAFVWQIGIGVFCHRIRLRKTMRTNLKIHCMHQFVEESYGDGVGM